MRFNFRDQEFYKFEGEEDEVDDNVKIEKPMDWVEYIKVARKLRLEKEINFLRNIDLINNNTNLFILFKKSIEFYTIHLNRLKYIYGLKKDIKNKYKNFRFFNLFNYYINLNYNLIKKIKENNFFSVHNNLIIILDVRPRKPKIFVMNKNRCFFSITSGIIYKRLNLKKKNIKKTEKMLNLMLKALYLKISQEISFKKCIFQIKGTRSNLLNTVIMIDRQFKNKKTLILYSPRISFSRYKFKKVKSIKRRLRKKFSKLIKN